jgi:phosphoglycolate phosphatase-like HAD superfamily hydrolase
VRIAIDIDSTLHHYWDLFALLARRRFGVTLAYDEQVTWDIGQLRREQVAALVSETHRPDHILAAEPYAGAVEVVAGWHRAGHFVHITSHRAQDAHEPTVAWLEQIGLPFDEVYCSWDKITRCAEIEIDVLVDDSPQNILRAQERGIVPATLAHPWNRELCREEGVICAADWPQLGERLAPVLAGAPQPR